MELSVVIPTRNEESIADFNLRVIRDYVVENITEDFEIIVCDHSEDATPEIVTDLCRVIPELRYVPVETRGIGAGLKAGFDMACGDVVTLYSIDMAWSLRSIRDIVEKVDNCEADIVLGSRGCAGAVSNRTRKRKVFSWAYNRLVNLLFGLGIRDTQCNIAFRKRDWTVLKKAKANGPIYHTELLVYAKRKGLRILEVPVVVNDTRKDSKVSPFSDGVKMAVGLVGLKMRLICGRF